MDINEEMRKLNLNDRITILEVCCDKLKNIDSKGLEVITAEVLYYMIENKSIPDELNPEKWHLPE